MLKGLRGKHVDECVELLVSVEFSATFLRERDFSIQESEEREITSNPYVLSRVPFGSLLANEHKTSLNCFSPEVFHSKAFCV